MNDTRRVDQLYVFISRMKDNPPPLDLSEDEMVKQHKIYLQDLHDRKILVGSGSAKDENGKRYAGGVVVLRAGSLAEAQRIASLEPYCREGQRAVEIIPWQRTWFET
ncbi:MAG TPA: YciI family protein [Beijerinckiaceae bacterium]|jgi:uncharacterized protein YciI|nr:YciI family protein [Beijerinckiaceae bacterium]